MDLRSQMTVVNYKGKNCWHPWILQIRLVPLTNAILLWHLVYFLLPISLFNYPSHLCVFQTKSSFHPPFSLSFQQPLLHFEVAASRIGSVSLSLTFPLLLSSFFLQILFFFLEDSPFHPFWNSSLSLLSTRKTLSLFIPCADFPTIFLISDAKQNEIHINILIFNDYNWFDNGTGYVRCTWVFISNDNNVWYCFFNKKICRILSFLEFGSTWSVWSQWSFCSNNVMIRVRACSTVRGFKCIGHNKAYLYYFKLNIRISLMKIVF